MDQPEPCKLEILAEDLQTLNLALGLAMAAAINLGMRNLASAILSLCNTVNSSNPNFKAPIDEGRIRN